MTNWYCVIDNRTASGSGGEQGRRDAADTFGDVDSLDSYLPPQAAMARKVAEVLALSPARFSHHSPQLPSRPPPTHTHVERAWSMASRWSALLYERPGRHGPRLLGFAWVDGGRDGSPPRATPGPEPQTVPLPSRCRPIPRRRHCLDRGPLYAVLDSWPPVLSTHGRASVQRGRSGPEAGAAPAAEPGARPAERSAAGA